MLNETFLVIFKHHEIANFKERYQLLANKARGHNKVELLLLELAFKALVDTFFLGVDYQHFLLAHHKSRLHEGLSTVSCVRVVKAKAAGPLQ